MKRQIAISTLVVIFTCFLISANTAAQDFTRSLEIPVPEINLNNGGTGDMIAGVDLDGDGLLEIYLVNDNWNDTPNEVIPRIYKLEQNGENWDVVWKAVAPIAYQNTWPPLAIGDLDKDGKKELIWAPINATSVEPNPLRILVYEHADGDVFGVATSETNSASGEDLLYAPNASWTILAEDNMNIRPCKMIINDFNDDGTDDIVFSDRTGESANGGYFFGVVTVSDIPDNADGSESWSLETSAKDFTFGTIYNKWDAAIIENRAYFFCEAQITKLWWNGTGYQTAELSPLPGGAAFLASQVTDLDNNGSEEIITAVYDYGDDARKAVVLLQEDGDTLKQTELFNVSSLWPGGSRGVIGSDMGDIDGDGYMDFVMGSRSSTPNAAIFRLAYRGGDITNPANYELSIIDSLAADAGIWNVINIANIDADPELEILYTSSTDAGVFPNLGTKPIYVLDYTGPVALQFDNLVVAEEVSSIQPGDLFFKPGRILDNGNTIWFCGIDGTNRLTYVFRSIDGGATFTYNATAIAGRAAQMDAFDANLALVATAEGKIYQTTDGGANWTEKYSYNISVIAPGWFDGLRVLNENVAVAYGDFEPNGNMHFVRTEDKGDTWTEITGIDFLGAAYGYYTWGLGACNVGESIWCSAFNMENDSAWVFRSYDAGVNWESFKVAGEVIGDNRPRSIAFIDDNNGMITADGGYIYKSTDGGATWSVTNKPDTSASSWPNGVVAIPNTNIIVAMDDIGVYYTTDLGATWGKMNTPAETDNDYFVSGVFLNKDFGYFFTDGGLVLRFENQVTGISERPSKTKPIDFVLDQNYPNPFNPTTTITYTVPAAERVSLKVYNLMGEEVKTLVNENISAGSHYVDWDATDNSGQKVTSGLYLYILKIGNQKLSKSMIFLK